MSHGVTYRTVWGRPEDVTLGHPQDFIFQCTKDTARGRPLALHRGSYGEVYRTSFEEVSHGCNFAESVRAMVTLVL